MNYNLILEYVEWEEPEGKPEKVLFLDLPSETTEEAVLRALKHFFGNARSYEGWNVDDLRFDEPTSVMMVQFVDPTPELEKSPTETGA
jgi:hypothetical protein